MEVRPVRLLGVFLIMLMLCVNACLAARVQELNPPGLGNGAGIWANIWNYPSGDLDAYCLSLRSCGVRNLFIQTSRTNMPAIAHPLELGRLIDACHRHHIRAIGWAYLELVDPFADADKILAAAHFLSPQGDRLDAIAPDLEKNLTLARVTTFSKRLRQALGANYPLIAVVYSPLNHYKEVACIPWKAFAEYFDVIAPMCYWNSKRKKFDAYDYTTATVREIRELTGRPDVEIHVIGDGMGTSASDICQFLKACRHAAATSASIYPNQKATPAQLASLSTYGDYFDPNSRFKLAAFRALLHQGMLSGGSIDPTQPLSTRDFYHLVTSYLHIPMPESIIANSDSAASAAPIYPDEALRVLAQIVDSHQHAAGKKRRADRWFAAPAMAEPLERRSQNDRPLNLLDACALVLPVHSAMP